MSESIETRDIAPRRIMSPELCAFYEKYPCFHRRGKNEKEKIREKPNALLGSPCWIWLLATSGGYGYAHYGSKDEKGNNMHSAHRLVRELIKGPVPKGLVLHHACHNRACVSPDHLEPGTQGKNIRQARDAGHLGVTSGEDSPGHQLTESEVLEIRRKYRKGVRGCGLRKLAKEYGVVVNTIRDVVLGKTWAHLLPETFRQSQGSTSGLAADKGALASGLDTSNVGNHWETVYSFSIVYTTRPNL